VLIYFDQQSKIDILHRIAKLMPSDGYLVLGAAETVVGLTEAFKPLTDRRGVYALNSSSAVSPAMPRLAVAGAAR
jgi:chemotaxis protein methyltransferase CheR